LARRTTLRIAFTAFTVAQLISLLGDRLHQFSVIGMIGRVAPGSSFELFQFALFAHVPVLLFAPLFGRFIDRADRATVLVVVDVIRGLIVAVVPILYRVTDSLYAFYITVFFLSLANLLFAPAKSAAIPEYFGRLSLLRINAILWGIGIVGTIGGFLVGGWLFDYHSWELSFYSDAASYLVSVVFLLPLLWLPRRIVPHPPHEAAAAAPAGRLFGGPAGSFREALAFLRSDQRVASGMILQTCLLGVFGVLYVSGIARVQEVLPAAKTMYFSAIAVAGTVGLLIGSVLTEATKGKIRLARLIAVCTVILGAAMIGVSQSRSFAAFIVWTALMGFFFSPIMVISETLLQTHTPAQFRGRVFAAREVAVKIAFLATSLAATLSAAAVDKSVIILVTGVLLAVLGVWIERKDYLRV
jgi:DHA3 family macrolide efflux protein-like MFS transporter